MAQAHGGYWIDLRTVLTERLVRRDAPARLDGDHPNAADTSASKRPSPRRRAARVSARRASGSAARSRRWRHTALTLVLLLAACSSSGSSAPVPTTALPPTTSTSAPNIGIALSPTLVANLKEVTSLTALGDSVPAGTACNCTPYPQLTAGIARRRSPGEHAQRRRARLSKRRRAHPAPTRRRRRQPRRIQPGGDRRVGANDAAP